MSSFIQKIRKAINNRSTFKFVPKHLQSAEFMQNNVIYSRYVVPTDKFHITPVLEGRCAALTNPSFINTEYHIRGFYVPHSLVWKRFDDFVNGNLTLINGEHKNTGVPYLTDADLTAVFQHPSFSSAVHMHTESEVNNNDYSHTYDFMLKETNGQDTVYQGYKFSNMGRFTYKLLRSLGIKFNFTLDTAKSDKLNALSLLSYLKVFQDYFVPTLFRTVSASSLLLSKVYETTDTFNVSADSLISDVFYELYNNYYPSDLLTSAWQQPQSPLGSNLDNVYAQQGNLAEFSNILQQTGGSPTNTFDNVGQVVGVESSRYGSINNTVSNLNSFGNPWIQRNLQKIADWLTRTRFVGSDKLTNILARFGVVPDNELNLRARMVGHFTQPLVVQDINATSNSEIGSGDNTVIQHLGDYSGKMFTQASETRTFDFNCDDYGCIIITSMITPHDIDYYQGIDRDVCKLTPLEWFQPEFDSMSTQLLSRRELISGFTFDIPQQGISEWMFNKSVGYVPRYAEYKHDLCNVSGDFAVNTLNTGYNSYHHFRSFCKTGKFNLQGNVVINNSLVPDTGNIDDINHVSLAASPGLLSAQSNMLIKAQDKNQYNRIFNVADNSIDHIYTMYYFNIVASRPMRSIADSIDIEDGSNDKVDVSKPVIENFN